MVERAEFEDFVEARSGRLLRTAYLLTRDLGTAEDLLQTALAKAWFAWSRIDTNPEAYVRRTMVTTYTSWWRRKWRSEVPDGDVPDSLCPDESGASDDRATVWAALGGLTPRQRAMLVLRYYEDLTEAQTANLLGCSVGTVKGTTSRALSSLRLDPALLEYAPVARPTRPSIASDEAAEILTERG